MKLLFKQRMFSWFDSYDIYDEKRAEKEQMDSNIKYHIEFFRNGLNAIIKLWLKNGCKETPEEMAQVLKQEYKGR